MCCASGRTACRGVRCVAPVLVQAGRTLLELDGRSRGSGSGSARVGVGVRVGAVQANNSNLELDLFIELSWGLLIELSCSTHRRLL